MDFKTLLKQKSTLSYFRFHDKAEQASDSETKQEQITSTTPSKFKKKLRPYIKPFVKAKDASFKIIKKIAGIDMWDEAAQLVTNADIQQAFKGLRSNTCYG